MNDLAARMQRAAMAHGRGDFAAAIGEAETALRLAPSNPAIIQFIGVVLCQSGRTAEGLKRLEKALSLKPDDFDLRLNTCKAAIDSNDLSRAREIVRSIADTPSGKRLLADIERQEGNSETVLAHYAQLAQSSPDDLEVLNNYGNALVEAGKTDEAIVVLHRALSLAQSHPQIYLNLGRAFAAKGDHSAALEQFERAAMAKGDDPHIRLELGKSLVRHGRHDQALPQLADAARLGEKTAQVFTLIGVCFSAVEERKKAEQAFRMALHVEPDSARAYLNLAILFEQDNRIEDLRELAKNARAMIAAGPDLDYIEALLLRRDGKFDLALELVEKSASESLDPVIRAQMVGQLCDRLGMFDRAFTAFAEMNAEMKQHPEAAIYKGFEHAQDIEARTRILTPQWLAGWTDAPVQDLRFGPAFLCGFLRSGTTLLDTILMGHNDTHVREEEPMIARLEEAAGSFESLAGLDSAGVTRMRDAYFAEALIRGDLPEGKLLIDKYPLATLRAAYVQRAFPDARFIFALRHPCDVVLSCWMQNFRITRAMASFLSLESAARMYDAAMAHWQRCREVMPLNVHTVRYEDLVEDLEGQLRPLLEFLNLDWDDSLLNHQATARDRGYIRTPSYAQVTEGIYRRAKGRWENYREWFGEEALALLAPWVRKWGYEPID